MTNVRRKRGGWVMLSVLAVLALLSALIAGFYVQTSVTALEGQATALRLVAAARADASLQDAIRALRSRQINVGAILGACTPAQVETLACPGMFVSELIDNGPGLDVQDGGGLESRFLIYRALAVDDEGVPSNRYVVRAIGYAGYSLDSPNLITSIVEAEVDVGDGNQFRCVGGYECQ